MFMSITNRDGANEYFNKVNKLVDEYMMNGKIRPSMLKRYMKPGGENFNMFLKMHDLSEVNGIDLVLKDIIEDRYAMEKDGIITFENFKELESDEFKITNMRQCLYKGIEKAGRSAEKAVADSFDTSLGHINYVNPDIHIFSVEGWHNGSIKVIAYSKEEMDIFYENLSEFLYREACKESLKLPGDVSLSLSKLIDEVSFRKGLDLEMGVVMENNGIGERVIKTFEQLTKTKFKEVKNGYYIYVEEI